MSQNLEAMYAALARLEAGQQPQAVADALGVSYASVLRWRREYEAAKEQGALEKLLDIDKLIVATAAANLEAPSLLKEQAIENFTEKLSGLQLLQSNLHSTALYMVQRIKSRAGSIETTSELIDLTEGLCAIQTAFFNSNKTQVNIQNNMGGSGETPYSNFLSDKPEE